MLITIFVVLVPVVGSREELEAMAWNVVEVSRKPFSELDAKIQI